MFGIRKTTVFAGFLATLVLLLLPVWPEKETASVELHPEQTRTTATLLDEKPEDPPREPRTIPDRASAKNMTLSVPELGLRDVAVPTGSRQAELDREGLLHMKESGLPWEEGSNTFIAGHALGYPGTRVPRAFYHLDRLMPGDEISMKSANGREYTFRVYDRMTVEPDDYWATYPVEGKTVVSLQTCTPIPTFENRLIVRAELI